MITVAMPISSNVPTSATRLPYRSPMWPNSTAPSGRAKYPTANVANAANWPAVVENCGKNSTLNTRAAAWP